MYFAGQNLVNGHAIYVYDRLGTQIGSFTFNANVANGADQARILLATPAAETFFALQADFDFMTPILPRAGGKVCFDPEPVPIDCVAWGGYTGPATNVGNAFNAPVGLRTGRAIIRRLDISGSPTNLDFGDDTNNSATDFVVGNPTPGNNAGQAGVIPPSTCGNSAVQSLEDCDDGNTSAGDGCSQLCFYEAAAVTAAGLAVDLAPATSNGNGVFESGETVFFQPSWTNGGASALPSLTGTLSTYSGPAGPTYVVTDAAAVYGGVAPSATAGCATAGNCYAIAVSGARPQQHWDASAAEVLNTASVKQWSIHVGGSFSDAPAAHPFYRFVETIFHRGITAGCGPGTYCPDNPVTRGEMAVFLLVSSFGNAYAPPPGSGTIFDDVPLSHPFVSWIEDLYSRGITAGCATDPLRYCPQAPVTREQMAVFLLTTRLGPAYTPPPAAGIFEDVPVSSPFAPWIEELFARGITAGCSSAPVLYCPADPNTRGQMAVFLSATFDLSLYGP
jgi:cysteine-rich repeat protein